MFRAYSLMTIFALLASSAASAPAQVTLKHKFQEGRKSTSVAVVKTKQTLTLAGNELVSGSTQSLTVTTANGQRAADGTLSVNSKIDALKVDVTLPGGVELAFDSAKPDADRPGTAFDSLLDVFKASAKATWETVLDKENRIIAVKGRDAAFADLPEAIREAMKAQVDPEYLKTAANDELAKLPSVPVSPGDSWERTTAVRLDSGQRLTFTSKYTYEGSIQQDGKKLEKITVKTTKVDYSVEGESPLKVVESDLQVAASNGVLLFDPAYGQIVSQNNKVQVKGPLKLEVMNMEFAGQLDLSMETSVNMKEVP
ncbi:MAG: DUF6263 family protein [Planctomycetota bacterium]